MELSNETMLHVKKEKIEYLQFKALLEYPEIVQAYSLKCHDINFKITPNEFEHVFYCYQELAKALKIDPKKIVRPSQTHSDQIKIVNNLVEQKDFYHGVDGLLTNQEEIILSLTYADCIPFLFYDPVKKVIGNIHSGWKGTVQKIAKKAVCKMKEEYNCNPTDIICCIGPSICQKHFEVKKDVYQIFQDSFGEMLQNYVFSKKEGEEESYYIDTVEINIQILKELGLQESKIIKSNICTVCNKEWLHSYRIEKQNYGTNTAIIGLRQVNN